MSSQAQVGTLVNSNCNTAVNYNAGCNFESPSTNTFGVGFNSNGGGVFATEWTSAYIKIWFFPRNQIPTDITIGKPDPSTWTEPQAFFKGGANCNIDSHFAQNQIIFDTTFCGTYGDALWPTDQYCKNRASSCEAFVAANPTLFKNA